jgi:hypothetical protein
MRYLNLSKNEEKSINNPSQERFGLIFNGL